MLTLSRRHILIGAGATGLMLAGPSWAATHEVQMLNQHPEDRKRRMVFYPRLLQAQAGDTITFTPVDPAHNSASIDGMIPDGAEAWNGRMNKEISVTLDVPGFYGYKCTPHVALGMVGLIVVEGEGKMANYEAAKAVKHRGRVKRVFEEIWAEVEESGLAA